MFVVLPLALVSGKVKSLFIVCVSPGLEVEVFAGVCFLKRFFPAKKIKITITIIMAAIITFFITLGCYIMIYTLSRWAETRLKKTCSAVYNYYSFCTFVK